MIRKGIIITKDGMRILGGSGSGNFGHAGIPGQRGGSAPGGSGGGSASVKFNIKNISQDNFNLNDYIPESKDPGEMVTINNSATKDAVFRVKTTSNEKFAYGWADYDKAGNLLKSGGGATDEQLKTWNEKARIGSEVYKSSGISPGEEIYIRYGRIPEGEKSKNYATGEFEKGVSAYIGEYSPESNSFKIGSGSGLDGASQLFEYSGKQAYLITGSKIGVGSDGEPILKNAKQIGKLVRKKDGELRLKD